MIFLLVLPILTAGFLVCNHSPKYYYRLHRYEGQHLYLKAASLGLNSFFITIAIVLVYGALVPDEIFGVQVSINRLLTSLFTKMGFSDLEANKYSWVFIISVLIHLVALFSCKYRKFQIDHRSKKEGIDLKILSMYEILNDSPLDAELSYSYIYQEPILISLNNRKVYVGIAVSLGEPNENEGMDQEISIAPLMSGYRDSETLNVVFDTNYQKINNDNDFKVTMRQELIVSVSKFDFDVYQEFQSQK